MKMRWITFIALIIGSMLTVGCNKCCSAPPSPVTPGCALSEWTGYTHGVEFVAQHSGIAILSAGNTTDPSGAAADVRIIIDKNNAGTDVTAYRDYTGHSATADKYWSCVTAPFKKGDGVTIDPVKFNTVHSMVYYFSD